MALPRGAAKTTAEEEEAVELFWLSDMDVGGTDSVLPCDQFWAMLFAGAGRIEWYSDLGAPKCSVSAYASTPFDLLSLRILL